MSNWFDPLRTRKVLALALPIIGGMTSQVILNLVDTAMVGRLGPEPQASVGLGSFSFLMFATVVTCLGTGVQAIVSRREGEGDKEAGGLALDTGLVLSVVIGLPLGYLLAEAAPWVFSLLSDDIIIVHGDTTKNYSGGSEYLAIRLLALGVVGANFCYRGFYNGIGRSSIYMLSIVMIQVLNIFFNWVFIFGNLGAEMMDVRGAALASVVAQSVGTCFYTFLTFLQADIRSQYRPFQLRRLTVTACSRLLNLAWPDAIRSSAVLVSLVLFLKLHGEISTESLAAGTILLNVGSAGFLLAMGMGLAGATMVGQNLGRNDPAEARHLVWLGVRLCTLGLLPAAIGVAIWTDPLLLVFTQDEATIAIAGPSLRLFSFIVLINVVPVVLLFSLLGAGDTRWVAKAQVAQQYLLMLPLAALLGLYVAPAVAPAMGLAEPTAGVLGLWAGMALSRIGISLAVVPRFQGNTWEKVQV